MTELLTNSGLKSLDPTKAHGCDNLSSIKMIQICKEITILLKLIFDRSLKKGKFPEIWKAANVVPVHKKENKCLNNEFNCVLEKVSNWAYQWKMQFNPDPNKQANEGIFSRKSNSNSFPYAHVKFSENNITKCFYQKHLGILLDLKLNCNTHIDQKIKKCNKLIGLIKRLSVNLP